MMENKKIGRPQIALGGGALAFFILLLLALLFAGCNLDGDGGSGNSDSSDSFVHQDKTEDAPAAGYYIEGNVYHVYTAEGLKAWNEAAAGDASLSCTLHDCINMSELEDFDWTPVGQNLLLPHTTPASLLATGTQPLILLLNQAMALLAFLGISAAALLQD